ncbi:GFA family protein [Aspergillus puulaauensis]|uniref:CENP-V/GFA domain-containing protein n=1 Tax=Aspergillus puulaauensis TaxID=1220207 RepID=A0A7R8ATR2_9EURO|nr:uncharacterized protein APUU_80765A [Aspergillus puulaauensis]BCS30462.1 hypothetical protein APUU_80765A [Aspergillus puulaauensis]
MDYKGSCHCGAATFSFSLPADIYEIEVSSCNCSICSKNGYLMVYPKAADMTVHPSEDVVTEYRWASKQYPHCFCSRCGTSLYAKGPEGSDMRAVNARTIDGIELERLKLKRVDGKSI